MSIGLFISTDSADRIDDSCGPLLSVMAAGLVVFALISAVLGVVIFILCHRKKVIRYVAS